MGMGGWSLSKPKFSYLCRLALATFGLAACDRHIWPKLHLLSWPKNAKIQKQKQKKTIARHLTCQSYSYLVRRRPRPVLALLPSLHASHAGLLGRFLLLHASHKSPRILIFSPAAAAAAVTGNSSSHLTFNFGPNVQRGQICRGHFGHMCAL